MSDFFDRLKIERTELDDKICKLQKYLESKAQLDNLSPIYIMLLEKQLEVMIEYRNILDIRIALLHG